MRILPYSVLCVLASASLAGPAAAEIPTAIDAAGAVPVLKVHAAGAQIYECRPGADGRLAWSFREPIATLMLDGRTVGRHYRGPTFEHQDGSVVVIKPVASAPSPDSDSIPWLRAEPVEKRGTGLLSGVTVVQRINTRGGMLQGSCASAGDVQGASYTADYVFLKGP